MIGPTVVRWEYSSVVDALDMASSYCMDILSLPSTESRASRLAEAGDAVDDILRTAQVNFESTHMSRSGQSARTWESNPISGHANVLAGLYDCGISVIQRDTQGRIKFAAIAVPVMHRVYASDGSLVVKRTRDSSTGHTIERVFESPGGRLAESGITDSQSDALVTGSYVYDAVLLLEGRINSISGLPDSHIDRDAVAFIVSSVQG
ncbi:hypothetical protein GORBP_081_01100 [Gordonia rubripertincta NBRC 101908]|uniref:Uncharacterized protein n=1 Tax=Gordonia rubripertincta NBRC 101908 TaxID=1077975 RepID=A0ABQ0HX20_GORRU|nr:hypothetical protein GORBP_081_01100 [Gordonia rubripertincta NBRC 101908]